jgi:hypothetical protein
VHARLSLITSAPELIDKAVHSVEAEWWPRVAEQPGNLGMAVMLDSALGVVMVESFWHSGDSMQESEHAMPDLRERTARPVTGTVSVERLRVASFNCLVDPPPGAGVRVTLTDEDPAALDDAVAGYEDTALPWLAQTEGFCAALLLVDPRTGRCLEETIWQDEDALAGSRSTAASIRIDSVAAPGAQIRAVAEYELLFGDIRPA